MKIAIIAHSRILGGIERHILHLVKGFLAERHQLLFCGPAQGWLGKSLQELDVEICDVPLSGMYDLNSFFRLRKRLKAWSPDVIHGHAARGARYALWAQKITHAPAVVTSHSTQFSPRMSQANFIIAVSKAVAKQVINQTKPATKTKVIYNGIPDLPPSKTSTESRRSLGLDEHSMILLMVARFVRDKGQDYAVEALKQLIDKGLAVKLLLAGDDTTQWGQHVRGLVGEVGLNEQVSFLGERSDIADLLSASDFVLAPSRREALSLSLIEAAVAKRVAIGANIGGIPEVISDGETGLIFEPNNIDDFVEKIIYLSQHEDKKTAMQHQARARYESLFTVEMMVSETLSFYQQAIDSWNATR